MLARFFIDRPIFAWVISILIIVAGLASMVALPIAQYPEITPPSVQVTCKYPGASARVVADTVAAPIEQQVVGVEKMLYMSSQSTNDGSYSLTVTFALGTDLNMAQVLVQNRVAQAQPVLPDQVQATGVVVTKQSPNILLVVNLTSEVNKDTNTPFFDQRRLSNYATTQVRDELARLDGVGNVTSLGQEDFSMRVWIDPDRLTAKGLTAADVAKVLREQNVQVAAGQLGQPPVPSGQAFQLTLTALGRLIEVDQFANIVLKTGTDGQVTLLRDVARTELGSKSMDVRCRLDGKPSIGLAVFQLPGSNALDVAELVKDKTKELSRRFPPGLTAEIVYDTTPFVRESVEEVVHTLRDAVILVAIVVLLFLQDWKALMLPLIDVGVSLVGTLAILNLLGFSLNNLTLFGLVLAIGIVVDDAIVVLENIERWIAKGLHVREATIHAMTEITGPIIAITLVLSSVFLPSAFIPGITGQFYRQFALTISASMLISAINAMTLTPARAASIFGADEKAGHGGASHHKEALPRWGVALIFGYIAARFAEPFLLHPLAGMLHLEVTEHPVWKLHLTDAEIMTWAIVLAFAAIGAVIGWILSPAVNAVLGNLFRAFNRFFDLLTLGYVGIVRGILRISFIMLLLYVGLLVLTGYGFKHIPTGFIPIQDKGYLVVAVTLPDSAALERTEEVHAHIEKIAHEIPGVAHTVSIPGMSIIQSSAISPNFGSMFIVLKPFDERHGKKDEGANAVIAEVQRRCAAEIEEARIFVFGAPPVDGLGNASGFKFMVEDRGDVGLEQLEDEANNLAQKCNEQGDLAGVFNTLQTRTPQMYIDINREKCKILGVELSDVFDALSMNLGGYYVNDFNRFGRTWQVNIQADAAFRVRPDTLRQITVRNKTGGTVPLSTVATMIDSHGPVLVTRFNTFPAATLNGSARPGVSSGTMLATVEKLADENLPTEYKGEWTELSFMQKQTGSAAIFAFVGAVLLVFLVLAAQYESWSMPMAVILVVPMCLLSALAGVALGGMDINIFVQVGFVVLVGLAAKNAILIVAFARERQAEGVPRLEASLEAAHTRLRPIIMTSLAFILGVLPLVIAEGAGAEMRRTLGTAVFSGMIGVTFFGIFLTPLFYYVIMGMTGDVPPPNHPTIPVPGGPLEPPATGLVGEGGSLPHASGSTGIVGPG